MVCLSKRNHCRSFRIMNLSFWLLRQTLFGLLMALLVFPWKSDAKGTSKESQISELRLQLERSPMDHKIRLALVKNLLSDQRYEEALTVIKPLCSLSDPAQPIELQSFYYQGTIFARLKQYDQASTSFQTILSNTKLLELRSVALFGLAQVTEKKGDPVGASEFYQQYLELEKRPKKAKQIEKAKQAIRRLSSAVVPIEQSGMEIDRDEMSTALATTSGSSNQPQDGQNEAQQGTQKRLNTSGSNAIQNVENQQPKASQVEQTSTQKENQDGLKPAHPILENQTKSTDSSTPPIPVADQHFASARYLEAAEIYRAHSKMTLPNQNQDVRIVLLHQASVSAFLAGQYRDAQVDAEEALAIPSQNLELIDTLKGVAVMSALMAPSQTISKTDARLALREGRFEDALRLIRHMMNSEGKNADLSRYEGKALMALGQAKEALKSFKYAQQRGTNPYLNLELAQAAEKVGDSQTATISYRAILQSIDAKNHPQSTLAQQAIEGLTRLGASQ